MNKIDFSNTEILLNLLPGLLIVGTSLLALGSIVIKRNHKLIYRVTVVCLIGIFIYLLTYATNKRFSVEPLFIIDGFGTFITGLIVLSTLIIVMISYTYFEQREERKEEYYILILLATLGASMLVISKHFVSLFLGLEILSVALYSMVAYLRKRERSDEAGIKYLILAAFSSAFLLFGMALVYTMTGSMDFSGIEKYMQTVDELPLIMMAGFGLMTIGVGFKLGVVPFHMWTPDVYEGAPAPVTAFIATVSKGGMVVLLVRFFTQIDAYRYDAILFTFSGISIASMFIGNFLALRQSNIKRLLAYSSIAHLGYMLVAFLAAGSLGVEAVCFYLVAYFVTTLGAFGIVAVLSDNERDAERLEDYRGLFWSRPWIATAFTAMLLSLAGIPLTAGFIGKFYIVAAGISMNQWLLVILLVINSVVGLYYYIKVIAAMFEKPAASETNLVKPNLYWVNGATLFILTILLVWFGVFPQGLIDIIREFLL